MRRRTLGFLLSLLALPLLGCGSTRPGGPELPQFLAYWEAGHAPPRCPPSTAYDCVSIDSGRRSFRHRARAQRRRGLEIVRFDAFIDPGNELYAAAWETSSQRHFLRVAMDWKEFLRRHRRQTEKGRRLVHLRVYPDGRRQRVAAIWTKPAPSEAPRPPAKVVFHQTLRQLEEVQRALRKDGYYLAAFDVYPRLDDPKRNFVAGVFVYGTIEAELRSYSGSDCLVPEPIVVVPADGDDPRPPACSLSSDRAELEAGCPFAADLESAWAEGLRPVAFESFTEDDEGRFVVLLHREEAADDWLMVPAVREAVDCRHRLLNGGTSSPGTVFRLLGYDLIDLDLLPPGHFSAPHSGTGDTLFQVNPFGNHNGLVHDGSTAGPPGG